MKNPFTSIDPRSNTFVRHCLLLCLVFFCGIAEAQTSDTVRGKVIDENGSPIVGVAVYVKGSTTGQTTDINGKYSLQASSDAILVFSSLGYKSQEIPVGNKSVVNITLKADQTEIDEIVVVGYGSQSRRTLATAHAKVDAEKINDVPVTSLATALQGKVAGARIYQSGGGQPGSEASIVIRGGSSINKSNSPLVLVDGVERTMDDLDPQDIESVNVLKDAASTAIYGSRASNGVILVTTKKGKQGKVSISFNSSVGIATPQKYMDMASASEYLTFVRQAAAASEWAGDLTSQYAWGTGNDAGSQYSTRYLEEGESVPAGYKSMADPLDPAKTLIFQDNDFQRLTLGTSVEQMYSLSATGGSKNIKFASSINYSDVDGIQIGTEYNRLSARANIDFRLNDYISLTTKLNHSDSKKIGTDQRDIYARSIWFAPTAKVYFDDGSLAYGQNATFGNPLWFVDVNNRVQNYTKTGMGASLNITFLPELKLTVNGDYYFQQKKIENFTKANIFDMSRRSKLDQEQGRLYQTEAFLTYNKTFNEIHNLNIVAGISYMYTNAFSASSTIQGAISDLVWTQNAGKNLMDITSSKSEEKLLGAFVRANYILKNRYIFSASLRRDASSRFARGHRTGYFPGGSAAWIISEEPFLKGNKILSTLKLRGSIGQTGNNSVGKYDYMQTYSVNGQYAGLGTISATGIPNPHLSWETTTQYDLGFDIGLLNDRISILLDYYNKVTDDLLFDVPLPNETGYGNIQKNVGSVKFYGFEVEIRANIIDKGKLRWDADFNLSYNQHKVLKLPYNGMPQNRIGGKYRPDGSAYGGIAEGERMDAIFGYRVSHILDSYEEAQNAMYDNLAAGYDPQTGKKKKGTKQPGDFEWVDIYKDGKIDDNDREVLGYTTPKFTGGISTSVTYGRLSASIFMDYALGHTIMDGVLCRSWGNLMEGQMNVSSDMIGATWSKEGDYAAGKAKYPRFAMMDNKQNSNYRQSDFLTFKGDYLCLREVAITYDLFRSEKSPLKRIQVGFSIQNAGYLTAYKGWTPEFTASTDDNYKENNYPVPRKYVFNVKLSF